MKFSIPAGAHSVPLHGIDTGREVQTGCGARSSRDRFTAGLEWHGTHNDNSATRERGEAVEETDLTKEEVEQLLIKRGEVVDVLYRREEGEPIPMVGTMLERLLSGFTREIASDARHAIPRLHELWCWRTQHCDVAADDSDSDDAGMEALVHGTPSRYATAWALAPSAATFPSRRKAQ